MEGHSVTAISKLYQPERTMIATHPDNEARLAMLFARRDRAQYAMLDSGAGGNRTGGQSIGSEARHIEPAQTKNGDSAGLTGTDAKLC
jgi:hypothetical protein